MEALNARALSQGPNSEQARQERLAYFHREATRIGGYERQREEPRDQVEQIQPRLPRPVEQIKLSDHQMLSDKSQTPLSGSFRGNRFPNYGANADQEGQEEEDSDGSLFGGMF